MLVSVDPRRLDDPEVVPAGERDRVKGLLGRFSREDLLRAFDLIARAEVDLRAAAEPRYHLEMALLKWIHLRKLVPLADLIEQLRAQGGGPAAGPARSHGAPARPPAQAPARAPGSSPAGPGVSGSRPGSSRPAGGSGDTPAAAPPGAEARQAAAPRAAAPVAPAPAPGPEDDDGPPADVAGGVGVKEALFAEIRRVKIGFYRMTVAQAERVEVEGDRLVFSFGPAHKFLKDQLEKEKSWLEPLASRITGRRMQAVGVLSEGRPGPASPPPGEGEADGRPQAAPPGPPADLKAEALSDPEMKTLLELLPLEIRDVEKM